MATATTPRLLTAAMKVIIFAACVAFCACAVPRHPVPVFVVPALTPHSLHSTAANSSKTDASALVHTDPLVFTVYQTHKAFLEHIQLGEPFQYSYGYEIYDWKTRVTTSHYESRYTDVGVGKYTQLAPEGARGTVDYTVDGKHGFHAVVYRDPNGDESHYYYASLAGRLAIETRRDLQAQLRTVVKGDHPLADHAFKVHERIIGYFNLAPPYRYSWGYQIRDSKTGQTRSQYEAAYENTIEGAFALIEDNGSINSIDYNINEQGINATSTVTQWQVSIKRGYDRGNYRH